MRQTVLWIFFAVGIFLNNLFNQDQLPFVTLLCISMVVRLYYTYSRLTIDSWIPALMMLLPYGLAIAYASFLVYKKEFVESISYWCFIVTSIFCDFLFDHAMANAPRNSPISRQKVVNIPHWWVNDTIGALVPLPGLLIYEMVRTFSLYDLWIIQASLILATFIISLAILTLTHHRCGVVMPTRCMLLIMAIATIITPAASLNIDHDRSLFASGLLNFTLCIFVSAADLTRRPNEEPDEPLVNDSLSIYSDDEEKPIRRPSPLNPEILKEVISQPGATAPHLPDPKVYGTIN